MGAGKKFFVLLGQHRVTSSGGARLGKPDRSHPAILVVVYELSSWREHTYSAGDDLDPERRLAPQLAVQMDELGRVGFDNVGLDVLLLLLVQNCGALWGFFTPFCSVQNDNIGHVSSELLMTGRKENCYSIQCDLKLVIYLIQSK